MSVGPTMMPICLCPASSRRRAAVRAAPSLSLSTQLTRPASRGSGRSSRSTGSSFSSAGSRWAPAPIGNVDQSVHPLFQEEAHGAALALRVGAAVAHHHAVALLLQHALHHGNDLRDEQVAQLRDDNAHGAAPVRFESARVLVHMVIQLAGWPAQSPGGFFSRSEPPLRYFEIVARLSPVSRAMSLMVDAMRFPPFPKK